VYNSYKRAKIGIEMLNVRKSCEECYIGKNKAALEYVKPTNCVCRIESTNHHDNKREEGNRKVSRDYVNFAVLGKMEAKAEEGPEMDVDGAPPTGQNGKRCRHIVSCSDMLLLARMFTRNIVNRRIFNSPYSHNLSIVNLIYNVVHITICVSDINSLARMLTRNIADHGIIISQYSLHLLIVNIVYGVVHITNGISDIIPLLFSLWLFLSCALVIILPSDAYNTVGSITECFRSSWYRE